MPVLSHIRSWSRTVKRRNTLLSTASSSPGISPSSSVSYEDSDVLSSSESSESLCEPYDVCLPIELERHIFEMTARLYPKSMPRLALVARRVQAWVDPLLYEIVTLYHPATAEKFLRVLDSKPPQFFLHVKTLLLSNLVHREDAAHILATCPGVVNLACWIRQSLTLPHIEQFHPQRLSLNFSGGAPPPVMSPDFSHSIFANVTHLDFSDGWELWSKWSGFHKAPRLTHLELRLGNKDVIFVASTINSILASCPRLKALVILVNQQPPPILGLTAFGDPRCVFLPLSSIKENWESTARGLQDRWQDATVVVEQQRKAIAQPSYLS